MSINRERLAGLAAALALLATVVLPGSAGGASRVAAGQWPVARRAAVAGAAGVAQSVPAAPAAGVARALPAAAAVPAAPAAGVAAAATTASPGSFGSQPGAEPGALGATAGGSGAAGTGAASAGTGTAGDVVAPPRVKATSVLLADEETGQVLFERAERQPRAMASTTKVMTGLLALERLNQRRTVVIGTEPTTVGEESLELRRGERLTVHQLLLGLLVKSANDAAVALADAVDGSEAAFVRRMNARAAELGLRDTRYVTAYGLDRPGHRTSARDLARLWEVAMRRADFRALVSTRSARLPGPPRVRKFINTNQLLGSYAWAVGGKTGFTNDAGRCLVASASRGGRRLVAVALGSPDAFTDVRALFEYGFTAFDWVRLAQRGQAVTLAGTTGVTAAYQVTADVDALVRRDLLDELSLAPPSRLVPVSGAPASAASSPGAAQPNGGAGSGAPGGSAAAGGASAGGPVTVWIQAGGQRLAPLRLGVQGGGPASSSVRAIPPMSSVAAALVPPGAVPAAIDPFLRRGAP
jgi:D-alanyl-D-alanine carboxypeptidase